MEDRRGVRAAFLSGRIEAPEGVSQQVNVRRVMLYRGTPGMNLIH